MSSINDLYTFCDNVLRNSPTIEFLEKISELKHNIEALRHNKITMSRFLELCSDYCPPLLQGNEGDCYQGEISDNRSAEETLGMCKRCWTRHLGATNV